MSAQPEVTNLAAELVARVTNVARSLVAAVRNWALYPPEHPVTRAAFDRLAQAIQEATGGGVFTIGVTPDHLMVEGCAARSFLVCSAALES